MQNQNNTVMINSELKLTVLAIAAIGVIALILNIVEHLVS